MPRSPFYEEVCEAVEGLGGLHNAHTHLDRANTLSDGYVDHGRISVLGASHISLQKKHALIQTVHDGPAYDTDDLNRRISETVELMIGVGTVRVDTMVDVTPDRVGLSALETMRSYAGSVSDKIDIRAAAYTPLGFSDRQPERWDIFEQGAGMADFIGALPEADEVGDYPGNIGFEEHCRRVLELARAEGKMLHVHTDQRNIPEEDGTERLISVMRKVGGPTSRSGEPMVWAVHMISPSTYDESRWNAFVDGLLECNIGVICCPSAAIGMRQIRSRSSPIYNSIPRILELAEAGVQIRLGSDNIADMCSPSSTADLFDEIFVLSNAIRYYDPTILGKFAAGVALDADDRDVVREHLRLNDVETEKVVARWCR